MNSGARLATVPTLATLVGFALALPTAAAASTVEIQGDTLVFTAAAGEQNSAHIDTDLLDDTSFNVSDGFGIALTPGPGCVPAGGGAGDVLCPRAGIVRVHVDLGDGNDTISFDIDDDPGLITEVIAGTGNDEVFGDQVAQGVYDLGAGNDETIVPFVTGRQRVDGGPGDDRVDGALANDVLVGGPGIDEVTGFAGSDQLSGGDGNDDLSGGPGNDSISGGGGNDALTSGDGNDVLDAGPGDDVIDEGGRGGGRFGAGADRLAGGTGTDTLTYDNAPNDLSLSVDGLANDGEAGEGDNIAGDFETIEGGWADDTIVGSDGPETLTGGFFGRDTIDGRGGADVLSGGLDDDTLLARDGIAEAVGCGAFSGDGSSDVDTAYVDATDTLTGCDIVNPDAAAAPPPPTTPGGPGAATTPSLRTSVGRAVRLAAALRRGLPLTLTVGEPGTAGVRLFVDGRTAGRVGLAQRRRSVQVGRGSGRARRAGRVRVTARFTRKARARLRRQRRVRLQVITTFRTGDGRSSRRTQRITLRR